MPIRLIAASFAFGAFMAFASLAHAVSTLRVGNQVLTAGDSEMRVTALLGEPSHKSRGNRAHRRRESGGSSRSRRVRVVSGESRAEQWQYRRDDHVTTVTIVDGKVADIDDRRL